MGFDATKASTQQHCLQGLVLTCRHIFAPCNHDLTYRVTAGRSETEIEYSVGFDANGIISALDCKAWCLAGAFMDLAWNDLYGVMTGLDMVTSLKDSNVMCNHAFKMLYLYLYEK